MKVGLYCVVTVIENHTYEAIKIKCTKKTEERVNSKIFGILGSFDALFEVDYYPNKKSLPKHKVSKDIMIELKTGFTKSADKHQLMCYLMVYFGYKALENFGVLLYTKGEKNEQYLVFTIKPTPIYFQNIILHRNQYILDADHKTEFDK